MSRTAHPIAAHLTVTHPLYDRPRVVYFISVQTLRPGIETTGVITVQPYKEGDIEHFGSGQGPALRTDRLELPTGDTPNERVEVQG